jgi:hypothetical protein
MSGLVAPVIRVIFLLVPLVVCAGRMRTADIPASTQELNRCLSALRVVCARRISRPNPARQMPAQAHNSLPIPTVR